MIQTLDLRSICIESTSYCNLRCPQCDRFDRQGHINSYMTLAHLNLKRVIENLNYDQLINLNKIIFEGDHGDPVMHPDIDAAVSALVTIPQVLVMTNGSLRSTSWWRQFARHPNLQVIFSIDGLEDTNSLYRINSDWKTIQRNAQAYINAGGSAVWKYIVFGHNQHQVDEARQLSKDLGFTDFITQISNRNFYQEDRFPVYIDGEYQGRDLVMASGSQTRRTTRVVMIERAQSNIPYHAPSCTWLNNGQIYIDYLGHLIPCCMTSGLTWRRDITGQLWQRIVGDLDSINLYHHTLSDILQSPFYSSKLHSSFQSIETVHHSCYSNCSK